MAVEKESLRALIGGRWAVSWQGYLAAWPFAVVFIFMSFPSTWESENALTGLVKGVTLGTGIYLGVGAVLWLASVTVLRNRREKPVPVIVVMIVGGLAWTTRALLLLAYMDLQGLSSAFSPAFMLSMGFFQGALAATVAAWVLASIDRFYSRRHALLTDLVQQQVTEGELEESLTASRRALLTSVQVTVRESVALPSGTERGLPPASSAHALEEASREVSRALAQDLWRRAARGARLSPIAIIRSAAVDRPFAYWGLLPMMVLGLLVLPRLWPGPDAVIIVGAMSTYALTVSFVANRLSYRVSARIAVVIYGVAIVMLACTSAVIYLTAITMGLPISSSEGALVVAVLWFGIFYPLVGIAAHIGRAQEDILTRLRQSITDTEIRNEALREETARMYREVAVSLHGGLQGDLLVASMRLRQALEAGDEAAAQSAIAEAQAVLDRDPVADAMPTTGGLAGSIAPLVDAWSGLVDITTTVAGEEGLPAGVIRSIIDVVSEGINNAVRHGDASAIDVRIRHDGDRVLMTITDDGVGCSARPAGLGSVILDRIAPQTWSIQPAESGGSVLTVELAASQAHA